MHKKKGNIENCKVYHAELWGLRNSKYDWLEKNDIKKTSYTILNPASPYYFFVPKEEKGKELYDNFWKISNVFPLNVTGIVTARDNLVIDFEKEALKRRIATFKNLSMPDEIVKQTFKLKDTRGWKLSEARKEVAKDKDWDKHFTKILYRPFDTRYIYYSPKMVDWPRTDVMPHMLHENLGLISPKQFKEEPGAFVTQSIIGHKTVSAYDINYLFPLYIYKEKEKSKKWPLSSAMMLFEPAAEYSVKKPNLSSELVEKLTKTFKKTPSPEEIFYYIYAVLYSETYRTKYAEFLKIDFPRVPFTKDYKLFRKISEYGNRLVDLHLLKSRELDSPIARYQGKGNSRVEKLKYDEKRGMFILTRHNTLSACHKRCGVIKLAVIRSVISGSKRGNTEYYLLMRHRPTAGLSRQSAKQ